MLFASGTSLPEVLRIGQLMLLLCQCNACPLSDSDARGPLQHLISCHSAEKRDMDTPFIGTAHAGHAQEECRYVGGHADGIPVTESRRLQLAAHMERLCCRAGQGELSQVRERQSGAMQRGILLLALLCLVRPARNFE